MSKMNDLRLLDIIAAYGASPELWPAEERTDAEAHLASDPDRFSEALDEARAIDTALALSPVPDLPSDLIGQIVDAAPMRSGTPARRWLAWPKWGLAPAMSGGALASLMIGLIIGYSLPANLATSPDGADSALAYAFLDADLTFAEDDAEG